MSRKTDTTTSDGRFEDFRFQVNLAVETLIQSIENEPLPANSRALAFAMAYGLKPKMCYTLAQTEKYTGISQEILVKEHDAGRLKFFRPKCSERGTFITCADLDAWIEENSR